MLLVGVLDKVGTFGFLRYCLPLFPLASQRLAPLVLTLAVIGILYGALLAVGQTDMKRFVSYTSIAHFGFIALGIFAFSTQALAGSALYMVNHGLSTGMLFVVVGMLVARGGSPADRRLRRRRRRSPRCWPGCSCCWPGCPRWRCPAPTRSSASSWCWSAPTRASRCTPILATVGIMFAALYVLWIYQRTMQGPLRGAAVLGRAGARAGRRWPGHDARPGRSPPKRAGTGFPDLTRREIAVLTPLVFMIMVLGFVPGPVLDVINPSVVATMNEVGSRPTRSEELVR